MRFNNIPGQEKTKEYLRSLVDRNRLPHALLFSGPAGNGKLALALAFTSYIECEHVVDGDSCGSCSNCRKSDQMIHPDIHYGFPTVKAGENSEQCSLYYSQWREMITRNPYFDLHDWAKEIATSSKNPKIYKSSVDELIKNFSLKIFEGKRKVNIIWCPELMAKESNKILKILEEPPENSVFILVSENAEALLPTITSRCQNIRIEPFSDEDLMIHSNSIKGSDHGNLTDIARIANGNIHEFIKFAEFGQVDVYEEFITWLRMSYKAKAIELSKWCEHFDKKTRNNQKYFFRLGINFFEQFLRSFSLPKDLLRLSEDTYETMNNMKRIISLEKAIEIIDLLNESTAIVDRNPHVKLQMMNSSLTLHKIMTSKS